jgi:hypothetical protein
VAESRAGAREVRHSVLHGKKWPRARYIAEDEKKRVNSFLSPMMMNPFLIRMLSGDPRFNSSIANLEHTKVQSSDEHFLYGGSLRFVRL